MKSVRWFSLLIALVTVAPFLTACTDSGTGPSVPGSSPAPTANTPSVASSPTATSGQPPYPGTVDKKDCDSVGGWVISGKDSTIPVKVEFYIDGKLIESATATSLRQDLTSWGTGRHGFTFKIPAAYKDGNPHTCKVKVAGADYEVPFIQNASGIQCSAS
jgi:hypothetical protein